MMESQLAPCNNLSGKALWCPHTQRKANPNKCPRGVIAGPRQSCSCCAAQFPPALLPQQRSSRGTSAGPPCSSSVSDPEGLERGTAGQSPWEGSLASPTPSSGWYLPSSPKKPLMLGQDGQTLTLKLWWQPETQTRSAPPRDSPDMPGALAAWHFSHQTFNHVL